MNVFYVEEIIQHQSQIYYNKLIVLLVTELSKTVLLIFPFVSTKDTSTTTVKINRLPLNLNFFNNGRKPS